MHSSCRSCHASRCLEAWNECVNSGARPVGCPCPCACSCSGTLTQSCWEIKATILLRTQRCEHAGADAAAYAADAHCAGRPAAACRHGPVRSGCRHAVAKQLGLAKHLHPPNKRSQPFVPGPPQPPSGSACMRFTCNMLAAMDACASAPGHCAAVQKLAQSDPLMHYVYCGDSFLTASGDGIVRVRMTASHACSAPVLSVPCPTGCRRSMTFCVATPQATMADGIHPTAAGLALLAQCLQPLLQTLIPSNSSAVGSGAKLHSFF